MRAFSIDGIENREKEKKKVSGSFPHSHTRLSSRRLRPSAIEGHFGMKNYMLETLFSSLESLHVLRWCRGADFHHQSILPSPTCTRQRSRSRLSTLIHKFLPSNPPPGFNKTPTPPNKQKIPIRLFKMGRNSNEAPPNQRLWITQAIGRSDSKLQHH